MIVDRHILKQPMAPTAQERATSRAEMIAKHTVMATMLLFERGGAGNRHCAKIFCACGLGFVANDWCETRELAMAEAIKEYDKHRVEFHHSRINQQLTEDEEYDKRQFGIGDDDIPF
jgi:hypothetical protein